MPSEGLDRALCVVSPPPTLPHPAPGPGGREPEGAGLRCPAPSSAPPSGRQLSAPRPVWHPVSALAIICKKAIPAVNLVKKSREM